MNITLENGIGDLFPINFPIWRAVLVLAEAHGWRPQGTRQPAFWCDPVVQGACGGTEWDGGYLHGAGQQVTSADAWGMAAALEQYLENITTLHEETRAFVERFIAFVQQGGFTIW
ncbi:MAG: hypothetical protein ACYDBB_17735 [Armatimonadota bacterium]